MYKDIKIKYEYNDFQIKVIEKIQSLPKKNLHYITAQQSLTEKNLTLPELKKLIKKGIKNYLKRNHSSFLCNKSFINYFCVFECQKNFQHSQFNHSVVTEKVQLGLHFHLFISCVDNYHFICFDKLSNEIHNALTSLKHKKFCISKYNMQKKEQLDDNFVSYHTKQFYYAPSNEMIMQNLTCRIF